MSPSDLILFFEKGQISQDCLDEKEILISSIADLLHICEDCKKGNLNKDLRWYEERLRELVDDPQSLLNRGYIHIADLDHDTLNKALFEREQNIVVEFWSEAANPQITPRRSVRYLTIKKADDSVWWSEDVYLQMEQYHSDRD
jgi:hypothetical protein